MLVMDPVDFSVPGVMESPLGEEYKKKSTKTAAVKEPPSRRAMKRKEEESQMIVYGARKNDKAQCTSWVNYLSDRFIPCPYGMWGFGCLK